MEPIPQASGDINRLTFGRPSTPVTVQSRLERRPAAQVRTEQAAPVSTRNSVLLPVTWRVTRSVVGVMRMDRVGSGAGQALRPLQLVCGNLSTGRFARNWGRLGLPLGPPTGGRSGHSPSQCPPFPTKGTLARAQAASWWSVQPSRPSRVPSRWWANQSSQKLRFLYQPLILIGLLH